MVEAFKICVRSQGGDLLYAKYGQCGKSMITCFVDIHQDSHAYLLSSKGNCTEN